LDISPPAESVPAVKLAGAVAASGEDFAGLDHAVTDDFSHEVNDVHSDQDDDEGHLVSVIDSDGIGQL
jgi:hypothetical protein